MKPHTWLAIIFILCCIFRLLIGNTERYGETLGTHVLNTVTANCVDQLTKERLWFKEYRQSLQTVDTFTINTDAGEVVTLTCSAEGPLGRCPKGKLLIKRSTTPRS